MFGGYCAAPFRHLAAINNHKGGYAPCCAWRGPRHPIHGRAPDAFDSSWMDRIRKTVGIDLWHHGCIKCHDIEKVGGESNRQRFNKLYGQPLEPMLVDMEINLGNLCNMRCRMCSSQYSSQWMNDDQRLGRKYSPLIRRKIDDMSIDLSLIERIKLIGGEPTLEQDQILYLLHGIRDARGTLEHLHLSFCTNGKVMLDDEILALLRQCRDVTIVLSLDGMQASNDYQRTGGSWHDITRTAEAYHAITDPRLHLCIVTTLSIFNMHDAMDIVDFVSMRLPKAWHDVAHVDEPEELAPYNLPIEYKQILSDRFRAWTPAGSKACTAIAKRTLIGLMQQPSNVEIQKVRSYCDMLDLLREENMTDHLPELHAALHADVS